MRRSNLVFILVLLITLLIPSSVFAQGGSYTITVVGEGMASGKPDIVAFEVGAEAVDLDSLTAYNTVVTQLETVRGGLIEASVAATDIELLMITITPQDRIDAGMAPTGEFLFRARGALHVVVRDTDNLDSILSNAVRAGADSIRNFTFGFEDITAIEQLARSAAITNAYDRADQIATAMSVAVGDPIIIREDSVEINLAEEPLLTDTGIGISPFPLEAGEVTISVQVQITFALRASR